MNWLFIVGINNGGTSLINHLLAQHPEIDHLILEGHAAKSMVGPWNYYASDGLKLGRIWSENPDPLRTPDVNVRKVLKEWLDMRVTKNGTYTMEKSPPNALRTPWLQENFPMAYFLIITRDPVAVAEGTNRKRPAISLERAAYHWLKTMEILYKDLPKLRRKFLLKYEELCAKPKVILKDVEYFLNIYPYDYSSTLDERIDLGYKRMRKSRIKDWNSWSYEQLTKEEINTIKKITKPMRERFGY